mmetsp:Transcript_8617/g.12858  ORF Transcript_8617/g.12858 Transcript_8617/m.12858 type:complete len:224 (-) Transcript_8617:128-799(-)
MPTPILKYFSLRGRGDVIRIALSLTGEEWDEQPVDYALMKQAGPDYPYGQAPAFEHNGNKLVQTDAILRYIGREWNLYGSSNAESSHIDMILGGVESIRAEYLKLCYGNSFSDEAMEEYRNSRMDPSTINQRNGGAHFQYLENILEWSESFKSSGFAVGGRLSIADIQLFDIVDLHLRPVFPGVMQAFPNLLALHKTVSEIPAVKGFLNSTRRPEKVNGNGLG